MNLEKILANVENAPELIRQIEAELGRDYVPRSEFNAKNNDLKSVQSQIGDLQTALDGLNAEKAERERAVSELTSKVEGYEKQALKTRVAHEYGLPFELASRLKGDDEDALRQDAKNLTDFIRPAQAPLPTKSNEPELSNALDASLTGLFKNMRKD